MCIYIYIYIYIYIRHRAPKARSGVSQCPCMGCMAPGLIDYRDPPPNYLRNPACTAPLSIFSLFRMAPSWSELPPTWPQLGPPWLHLGP